MKTITIQETDFSYMNQPHRQWCEKLQAKALEILPTRRWRNPDHLLNEAAFSLAGNDPDEHYTRIYICENCHQLYHGDYSTNQDENHDFCGAECEVDYKRK